MRKLYLRAVSKALMFVLMVLVSSHLAAAQSNAVDGAVNGYVTDPTGGAIPNATVRLTNQGTNIATTLQSGKDGYFRYPLVPVGTYTLSVKAQGFEEYRRDGVTVNVGSDVTVSPVMKIGAEDIKVEVFADASMLDRATPAIGGLISQTEMENLPLTSRNIYNLFFFTPGVKGIPSDNFATPGYSFGGVLRASWTLDGIDDADRATTSPLRLVIATPGAVKQIQVLSNGYQAEFGKTAGGQTSVITRGGDNTWHGSAMYMYRPRALAAIPALSTTHMKTDLHWFMAEGNLGGPIIHDRLFFFANYEHNPYVTPVPNTITAATIAALGLTPDQVATVNTAQNYDSPSIRIDYRLNEKNSGFLRYIHFTNNSPYSGGGGLIVSTRTTDPTDEQDGGEAQLATVFTPNLLNELRVGVNRRETTGGAQFAPSPTDVDTNISGYADIGNSPSTSNLIESLNQVIDNVTWQLGRHTVKAGADYQLTNYYTKAAAPRTYTFSGENGTSALVQYENTLAGDIDPVSGQSFTYTTLSIALGDPSVRRNMHFFNAFVQDQYRVARSVTVTGGLRYEKQLYPEGSPDANYLPAHRQVKSRSLEFAPRGTISWQANPTTQVSVAGGLYFDVPNILFFTNIIQDDGNAYHSYTISPTTPGAPIYPAIPDTASLTAIAQPDQYTFDPTFKSMYAVHGNARVQQVLSQNFMLTLSYMFQGTRSGPYVYDTNLTPTGLALGDGRPTYTVSPRPNTNFGRIYQWTSHGTTNYHGLDVTIDKRVSHGLEFVANYSWSHALGDSDQNGYVVTDPSNVRRDYGNLSTDVRHYFVARTLYTTGFKSKAFHWASGIGFSMMSQINSGYPLDARTSDLNGDGASNDRPLFFERNQFRGPHYLRFDARVSKTFKLHDRYKLQAIFEGSNIFNHKNAACSVTGCNAAVNGTYNSTGFGNVTVAAQSRTAQAGARFTF